MRFFLTFLLCAVFFNAVHAQNMSNEKLNELLGTVSDSIVGDQGRWQFYINEVPFICITDSTNNRMRIISPILETFQLNEELKNAALTANFHTALDVKYAISNEILWSAFIHPFRELSDQQVLDAIEQVYSAIGLVDIKVASVDDNWSALKFAYRLKDRK